MPVARLLIVEDEPHIAKLLCQFLSGEGFETSAVSTGELALSHSRVTPPDLIILDLLLPGMDGVATCQALREFYAKPVLMLTAQEGDMHEVIALNAGVDDFVQKPIRPHVLKARIHALLRRHTPMPTSLLIAGMRIDRESRRVLFNEQTIDLTESEFELLWALASRAGEVVTRDVLFQHLRCRDYDGLDRSIDMRVSKLRKKLAIYSDREFIRTLRQIGYVFVLS
ncbi:MAG TPA: response regulator transcription factor [Pseudoduganella sp.]